MADRPGRWNGDRWNNNNIIHERPSWANINNSTNININNRWNNSLRQPARPGWWNPSANRIRQWDYWGSGVRNRWNYAYRNRPYGWFNNNWWAGHYFPIGGWHYRYWGVNHPPGFWWRVPAWGSLVSWFVWSNAMWTQPVYYDYGTGGNVVYEDNTVYIGGEPVATANEFAASAMDLATVEPPASEEVASEAEWMPLGTFALSMDKRDVDPNLVVQLAVDKQGVISGTLYNMTNDQAQAIQGQVDKETQRVAFRLGENQEIVAETGLYNLTQDEVPLLVHYGPDKTETYLLVRLDEPPGDEAQ